jgi:hypothetical protein
MLLSGDGIFVRPGLVVACWDGSWGVVKYVTEDGWVGVQEWLGPDVFVGRACDWVQEWLPEQLAVFMDEPSCWRRDVSRPVIRTVETRHFLAHFAKAR